MLLKKIAFYIYLFVATANVFAQNYQLGFGLSNNGTAWPVIGYPQLFYSQFHPGIDIVLEKHLNKKTKNQWWAEANLGMFYHRFFQTPVKLNFNLHYRYCFNPRVCSDIGLGGGYLYSFYQYQVFKLNSNGYYVRETGVKGRSQFVMGFCLGTTIGLKKSDPDKFRLLIQFRSNVQGIFAGSFIPVVPYNAFLIGITRKINFKEKKHESSN